MSLIGDGDISAGELMIASAEVVSVRLLAKHLKVTNRFHLNFQEIMEQAIDDYILVMFGIPEAL